jgi:hypothetical protein
MFLASTFNNPTLRNQSFSFGFVMIHFKLIRKSNFRSVLHFYSLTPYHLHLHITLIRRTSEQSLEPDKVMLLLPK